VTDRPSARLAVLPMCAALSIALALSATPALGQVAVRVQSSETLEPMAGAIVTLTDSAGSGLRARLTDRNGRTFFADVADGTYRLRVEMIGRATEVTDPFPVPADQAAEHLVRLGYQAIPLEGVDVAVGPRPCRAHPLLFQVWDDVRKALTAAVITEREGIYRFQSLTYLRQLDDDEQMLGEEQSQVETATRAPYVSLASEDLVQDGFVREEDGRMVYYGPDAEVLLSDAFLKSHCFRVLGADSRGMEVLGLGFEPLNPEDGVADISGALWVDRESGALRWLDFQYQGTDPAILSEDAAGYVQFRRMPAGTWIVSDWWIRIPDLERSIRRGGWIVRGFFQRGGRVLEARDSEGRSAVERATRTGIEGFAVDADGAPALGISIRATGDGPVFTTETVDDGSFSLLGLPEGEYEVQAVDPRLAVFGYQQPSLERPVQEGEMSRADIRFPTLTRALIDRCRTEDGPLPRGNGIVAGLVRDADTDEPVAGATVTALWQRSPTTLRGWETTSSEQGAYLMCGLPQEKDLQLYSRVDDVRSTAVLYPGDQEEPLRWLDLRQPAEASR
jgi:hypothetical protein